MTITDRSQPDSTADHAAKLGGRDPEQPLDRLIHGFDRALRTLAGATSAARELPQAADSATDAGAEMTESEKSHAAGLMRVNHSGEVCAQALYDGQALLAREPQVRDQLKQAAAEESDHLAWCAERLDQLEAKPSVLNPLFYAASFTLGAATALLGDKTSLGFVEATEAQVVQHLDEHLVSLPEGDETSRAILNQMREDEARHGEVALAAGGQAFPPLVKQGMSLVAKLMTATTYRV